MLVPGTDTKRIQSVTLPPTSLDKRDVMIKYFYYKKGEYR